MKITTTILAILTFAFTGNATDLKDAYYFLGGRLNVIYDGQKHPVVSMNKGYVHYDDGLAIKKTKSNAPCTLGFEPSISSGFVEMEILKSDFFSVAQQKLEAHSIQTAFEIGGAVAAEIQEMVDERSFDNHHLADSIQLKANLLSNTNLSSIYCAIILRHEKHQRKNGSIANAGTFVKAHYLGNIKKDQPTPLVHSLSKEQRSTWFCSAKQATHYPQIDRRSCGASK